MPLTNPASLHCAALPAILLLSAAVCLGSGALRALFTPPKADAQCICFGRVVLKQVLQRLADGFQVLCVGTVKLVELGGIHIQYRDYCAGSIAHGDDDFRTGAG